MEFITALQQASRAYGLTLTEAQTAAFTRYFELLVEWNEKINLTAITAPQEVAVKHMIDSLSCLDPAVFTPGASVIDVGTGAGFPGLPLRIVREDLKLTLLDSLNKRILFLQEVAGQVGLENVAFVHSRAEDGGRNPILREQFQIATARAVARLPLLCEYCLPFVKVGGYFVALKGAQYEEETAEGKRAIELLGGVIRRVQPVKLPGLEDVRAVIYIEKVKPTPKAYPRRPGLPEKKPL